ncbi:membrane integrity-associated transporter subunit PqiC [Nitratifractor sp.]|uniref:PqiC family protein n=1 Tax=Nitratifractor sp. TaxID=2268144 RepID=UPI0025ED0533|nr:PqiC family protein [Nitratifractor sp.]
MKRPFAATFSMFLLLLLAGCSSKSDYYRLQPRLMPQHKIQPLHTHRLIGIGEVQVADYLEQKSLTTRISPERLQVHDTDLWAGSLSKNIQQVLQSNLSQLLPSNTFLAYPWEEPLSDAYRLYLTVDQFDGDANGTVTLSGHWSLVNRQKDRLVLGENFRLTAQGAPETSGIVATQSRLLERLSRRIAARIRSRI